MVRLSYIKDMRTGAEHLLRATKDLALKACVQKVQDVFEGTVCTPALSNE